MAKKKSVSEQEVEQIVDVVEPTEVIEEAETVEEVQSVEEMAEVVEVKEPEVVSEEPVYNPKDIVEFYNLKGELRYAPYAYITKRGYTALRKYTKKK